MTEITAKFYLFLVLFFLIAHQSAKAQNTRLDLQKLREPIEKDTINTGKIVTADGQWHISLKPVEIVRPYVFTNERQKKKYDQLLIDVKKAYPLSLIVGSEYRLVNSELDSIYKDKSSRKKYIKWYQDYVYKKYVDSLKTLNVRQGKLLLKLISRETGKSSYDLINEYRGGLNAFFWQSMAFMFGANLKSEYDPVEDAMIENIVRRIKSGEFNN
jgi:hypothetical protein